MQAYKKYWEAIQPIVGICLMFNWFPNLVLYRILSFIGFLFIINWLYAIAENSSGVSGYLKNRIGWEGLHSLSIGLFAGLIVVLFLQKSLIFDNWIFFLAILLFAFAGLITSEHNIGKLRTRSRNKKEKIE